MTNNTQPGIAPGEIAECPRCKGTAHITDPAHKTAEAVNIVCLGCGMEGPIFDGHGVEMNTRMAVTAWNTRPREDALREKMAAMRHHVRVLLHYAVEYASFMPKGTEEHPMVAKLRDAEKALEQPNDN